MNRFKSLCGICVVLLVGQVLGAGTPDPGGVTMPVNPPGEQHMPIAGVFIHKKLNGTLNDSAQQNLIFLQNYAQSKGPVALWVTFNMSFQSNPDLRTEEVIIAENLARESLIEQVILPLINEGHLELLETPVFLAEAPGCFVKANDVALYELAHSINVQHINTMR